MKNLFFLALSASAFTGCSGSGAKCDTSDTSGCVDSSSGDVLIQNYGQEDCSTDSCTWYVVASGEMGTVELWMIETGDPTYEAGCSETMSEGSGLVCGVWSEYHNNFDLTDTNDSAGEETKAITLDVLAYDNAYLDQETNVSTLFTPSMIDTQLTWYILITDSSGNYADCITAGHDDNYFSGDCPNSWE